LIEQLRYARGSFLSREQWRRDFTQVSVADDSDEVAFVDNRKVSNVELE
jgi:hypothetical protein